MEFWNVPNPWIFSLTVWLFLVSINAVHVKAYGELGASHSYLIPLGFLTGCRTEYWLSSLKVVTIIVFILLGILVNVGANYEHRFIGFENWKIPGAPFVGGFGGFAHVFVTASFACALFPILKPHRHLIRSAQLGGQRVLESLQAKRRIRVRTCHGLSSSCFGGACVSLENTFCVSAHCILQHNVILHLEHLINRIEWCAYSRTLYIIFTKSSPF